MDEEVYIYWWECPVCGAVVKSLSREQTLTNARNHLSKHRIYLNPSEIEVKVKIVKLKEG